MGSDQLHALAAGLLEPIDMTAIYWFLVGIVAYTYAGYPLLLILLSAVIRKPVRRNDSFRPSVSLLITAHNEEAIIEKKIINSLALDYPEDRLDIVVASDGSSDKTNDIARRFESEGVVLFAYERQRGKVLAMNESICRLSGEIVVLSDASVMYEPDALIKLVRNFSDPDVGGVWGDKDYRNPDRVVSGEGEGFYLKYEKFSKRRENMLGSIVSAEGSMFALRRSVFEPIPDPSVADDYYLSALIRHKGYRLIYEPEARSHEEVAPTTGDEFRRKVRIIQGGLRGFFLMKHLANPFRYGIYSIQIISRQFLRRAVAFLFPIILTCNIAIVAFRPSPLYLTLLTASLCIPALAAIGAIAVRRKSQLPFLIYAPHYFMLVNLASIQAMWRLFLGQRAVTWKPTTRKLEESA